MHGPMYIKYHHGICPEGNTSNEDKVGRMPFGYILKMSHTLVLALSRKVSSM